MKVFVTGGTGFIGTEVVKSLVSAGHEVRVLVRRNGAHGSSHLPDAAIRVDGDIFDTDIDKHLEGVDAVVNLVGIIREIKDWGITFQKLHVDSTKNIIRAMTSTGVKRLIQLSALGSERGESDYFRTKLEAEKAVKNSSLVWTIIKPSVVYGLGDGFVNMLASQVRTLPVVPVIGDGNYELQPVHVKDVATGVVKALSMVETETKSYEVGGLQTFSYNRILDEIARALGKIKALKVHFPLVIMRPSIAMLERYSFFPITTDQLKMLLMSNTCDEKPYMTAFGIDPVKFRDGISEYVKRK
ncbi:MAG: complex I NDUFA9 subunit family protein [Deltaproteobacteria bacterium]|nr:complex I NDUFA9 subunit family protein [Deltaproteobacteria bacterium]